MKAISCVITLGTEKLELDIEFKDDDYATFDNDDLLFEIVASAIESGHLKIESGEIKSFDAEILPFDNSNLH